MLEGCVDSFRAQVSDDNPFEKLDVAWVVDEEEVCRWEVVSNADHL